MGGAYEWVGHKSGGNLGVGVGLVNRAIISEDVKVRGG